MDDESVGFKYNCPSCVHNSSVDGYCSTTIGIVDRCDQAIGYFKSGDAYFIAIKPQYIYHCHFPEPPPEEEEPIEDEEVPEEGCIIC